MKQNDAAPPAINKPPPAKDAATTAAMIKDEKTAAAKGKEEDKKPPAQNGGTKKRGGCFPFFLLLLIGLGGGGYYLYQRDGNLSAVTSFFSAGDDAPSAPRTVGDKEKNTTSAASLADIEARLRAAEQQAAAAKAAANAARGGDSAIAALQERLLNLERRIAAAPRAAPVSEAAFLIALADLRLRADGDPAAAIAMVSQALSSASAALSPQTRATAEDDMRRLQNAPSRARLAGEIDAARGYLSRLADSQHSPPPAEDKKNGDDLREAIVKFAADILVVQKKSRRQSAAFGEIDRALAAARIALAAGDSESYQGAIAAAGEMWDKQASAGEDANADNFARKLESLAAFGLPDYRLAAAAGLFEEVK